MADFVNRHSDRKKIKVLHFLTHGKIGGQERAQYQLLRAFSADDEFEFAVAIGINEGHYVNLVRKLEIEVIDLNISGGLDFRFSRKTLKSMGGFQIHHFHDTSPNHILMSLMSGKKIKRVFTRRGGIIDYSRYGFKRSLKYSATKFLLRSCFDGYSGNTRTAVEFMHKYYGIKSKVYVLYNGLDFKLLETNTDKDAVSGKLKLSRQGYNIGTACHLLDWKRVDLLIKAFGICKVEDKKLIIFGKGPEHDNLQRLASSMDLEKQVLFAGEVPDMMNYYQLLDCFVLASGKEESFGNAVVEAMYHKVPTFIMSDAAGLREHIVDSVTGYVAEGERDLARKIEFVHDNPGVAREVAETASRYVVEKYSINNMKTAYKQFYRDVLQSENRAHDETG
ncbi:MAG: hypothetical protein A2X59_08145 [Nitrospirae bacterium GWC2_42_7]|nr:MAG: hypothetical protein A2X59_08145 [Nitrospirae bacterium GWC2_42_7]